MRLKIEKESHGKLLLIGASIVLWLLILILFREIGYGQTWNLWKVPSMKPIFLDFRLIPGSADSFMHGYEPSVENPLDPTERIFNYPAFWRLFFYTGISQEDTVWVSISMIVLFFIACFLFPEKLTIPGAVGMLFVLFSPASMLLYERGNVDLIVFFVCAMIVMAESYSAYLATALIVFASIMKLFPILGLTVLLREPKRKFIWLSVLSVLLLGVYMAATWSSVQASWSTTMRGDGLSYGTDVFVDRYTPAITLAFSRWLSPGQVEWLLSYGPLVLALGLLLFILVLAFLEAKKTQALTERNLAAFRMGASIYVGTFLLGNNWDYRLAFLVILVPQLVEWMRSSRGAFRLLAWSSLVLILLSCWHLWIVEIPMVSTFNSVEDSRKFWIILDEIFNWLLFVSLAYLLFASTPEWVKELPRNTLSKVGIRPRYAYEQNSSPLP